MSLRGPCALFQQKSFNNPRPLLRLPRAWRERIKVRGILLLIVLLISSNVLGATISKKTIKPAGQGGDYTSLAAWQTGELGAGRGNLVSRDEIAVAEIDGNWTSPDSGPVVIAGWTTDANHYVKIYTTPAARHSGVWDTAKYRIHADCSGNGVVDVCINYAKVDGLQVSFTGSNSVTHNSSGGIYVGRKTVLTSGDVSVSNCIVKRVPSANMALWETGIGSLSGCTLRFWNNIIYDINGAVGHPGYNDGSKAIYYGEAYSNVYMYNNTCYNNGIGIMFDSDNGYYDAYGTYADGGGHVTLKNNICVGNLVKDYYSRFRGFEAASCNNISSDDTSPNASFRNMTVTFDYESGRDLHLASQATDAIDSGADLSGDSYIPFDTDIDGDTRPSGVGWDIGADERMQGAITDTTPPGAPPAVRDGTGISDSGSTTLTTQLSANWTAATDAESGISGYKYAIGTTAGGTNVAGWTTIGRVTTITKIGLSLIVGTTYYFSVKAINGATPVVEGSATNSNGQYVTNYAPSGGVLSVHPTNPRYFTDSSGRAIYMTGSYTFMLVQTYENVGQMDNSYQHMEDYVDWMKGFGHNYFRMWSNLPYCNGPFPWERPGPGMVPVASDDPIYGQKFDLTSLDQDYFDLLRERVIQMTSQGIYVSVCLFGSGVTISGGNWIKCAWYPTNNVNSETSVFNSAGSSFYTTNTAALNLQKLLVAKTIDTLNDQDNIIWEIINEPYYDESHTWQNTMADYIRSYEQGKPKQHLVLMSGRGHAGGNPFLLNSSHADCISPEGEGDYTFLVGGDSSYSDRIIINDTDHLCSGLPGSTCGLCSPSDSAEIELNRKWVWRAFCRGTHPIFLDASYSGYTENIPALDPIRNAMGRTKIYADQMDLANATPQDGLSSTGYCLAKAGSEYLVYSPNGGNVTVNLTGASGTLNVEWFNPNTGAAQSGGTTTGGASRTLTPPFSGDAVLYISANTQVEDTTPPSAPGTIRDGTGATDIGSTTFSTQLSANWTAAIDAQSGIAGYSYAIGTSPGATNMTNWTATGNVLTVTKTGLSLTIGTTYYFSVKAVNGAGLTGAAANSNGQFVKASGTARVYLSDLNWSSVTNGWGPVEKDMSNGEDAAGDGATIILNGATYAKGLGAHAASQIVYDLGAQYETFECAVGVDDEVGTAGSITFEVWVDNVKQFDSGIMNNSTATRLVNVSVSGASTLKLVITDAGNGIGDDHGDWADARLTLSDVTDTTAPSAPGTVRDGTGTADTGSTTLTTQLSANWTASADSESGIAGYNYAIGTTAGATNITNWTAMGNVLTVTKTGLNLTIGSTYYFSVKAVNGAGLTGGATNSNGQVVLSTAVPDTTAPSAPGTVRDGPTAGTDAGFTYSTTALSANWTASTDNESGITNYQFSIGTSPGATNITNWITLGNVLTVTKTGLSLAIGTTYYFSVRAINGYGLAGTAANSDGQYVKEINTGDTTPPGSIAQVRDGNETGTDASVTYLTDELSANWSDSADSESGISRYLYAIGTAPGATDIINWKDNGPLTDVTETGLILTAGTTYYFSVKAENGVGLQSAVTNSDGQLVLSQDSQCPLISNVSAQSITQAGATITWATDEPSTSRVEYGLTVIYGGITGEYIGLITAHSVTLTGLLPGTQYHYRVTSRDGSGNGSVSVDFSFTTLSTPKEVAEVKAYPNPCDLSRHGGIKFKVSAAGSETGEVKIYTISGKLVRKLAGTGEISWDGKNEAGEKVSRGIYLYTITQGSDKVTGKFAVTR